MAKIRINDLARELEVKSRVILDALLAVGFTEHKTHSSAVEEDVAEQVRRFVRSGEGPAAPAPSGAGEMTAEAAPETDGAPPVSEIAATSERGTVAPSEPPAKGGAESHSGGEETSEVAAAPPAAAPSAPAAPEAPRELPRPRLRMAPAGPPLAPPLLRPSGAPRMPIPTARPVYAPPVAPSRPAPPSAQPGAPSAHPGFQAGSQAGSPARPQAGPQTGAPAVSAGGGAPPAAAPAGTAPASPAHGAAAPPLGKPAGGPLGGVRPGAPAGAHPAVAAAPPVARPMPRVPTLNVSSAPLTGAAAPPTPGRRVIVPVAPQRPVYQAPAVSAAPRPAPGKPIYQRPASAPRASAVPAGRVPEGRRPMHPTRPGAGGRPGAPGRGRDHGRREPRVKEGPQHYVAPTPANAGPLPITREITIAEGITVKDLSERLQIRAKDVIRKLLDRGLMVTVNQSLDANIATDIAREFGAAAKSVSFEEEALGGEVREAAVAGDRVARAPVVTIMGHVDHGKTSLLDAIRETNVAAGEAGGITQHIGAHHVEVADPSSPAHGRRIVFIDTPGHEAFTRMRARGARITDLVVLVVAADDGVMPQTLEAMDHAKAAGVPILVAVNKIDRPDAQPDRVKKQLGDRGLLPEEWGGTTVMVNVSAKAKTNLNQLLEMILLVSDLQELKANPDAPAQGAVLEAELDRGRGPVARVLVQEGTLRVGDTLILGSVLARARALFDDRGRGIESAGPSTPVEVLGLESLPEAGDRWMVVNDRYKAKQIALFREEKAREQALARASRMNLEALSQQVGAAGAQSKELPLIIKADVLGSAEVLVDTLGKLSTEKVKIRIIHSGVGAITETDVLLASASNAVVIGFNVRPERKAADLAEHEKVEIRLHSIIYELSDEIKKAMLGLLEPVSKETVVGRAEVRETFRIPKVGAIAGCYVRDGKIARDAQVRVVRDGVVVYSSKISSLRRFKEDAAEVRNGLECGIGIANFSDIKPGDVLEAYSVEKVNPTLGAALATAPVA